VIEWAPSRTARAAAARTASSEACGAGRGHCRGAVLEGGVEAFPARGQLVIERAGTEQPAAPQDHAEGERSVDPQARGLQADGRIEGHLADQALLRDQHTVEAEPDGDGSVDRHQPLAGCLQPGLGGSFG
jgi:hypothetical protein